MKFDQLFNGQRERIRLDEKYFVCCCHCGLVHRLVFDLKEADKGIVGMRATVDKRKTAEERRTNTRYRVPNGK